MTGNVEDDEPEVVLTVDPRSLWVDLRVLDGEYVLLVGDGVQAISIERGATGAGWHDCVDGLKSLQEEAGRYIDIIEGQASRAGHDRIEHTATVLQCHARNDAVR